MSTFATSIHDGNLTVRGELQVQTNMTYPVASIKDVDISAFAAVQATKLIQQRSKSGGQASGSDVVTQSCLAAIITGLTGKITKFQVCPDAAPSGGGDKQYTIDLKKGNAGSGYATILTGVIIIADADNDRTPKSATISLPDVVVGDSLLVEVIESGATGNQGQGFTYELVYIENPT